MQSHPSPACLLFDMPWLASACKKVGTSEAFRLPRRPSSPIVSCPNFVLTSLAARYCDSQVFSLTKYRTLKNLTATHASRAL